MAEAPRRNRTSSATDTPTLRPFQREDVEFIKRHDYRVFVANAPGTGKSATALGCVNADRTKLTPTLIVCPASVVTNWCREARKWVPGAVIHAIGDMATPMPKRKVDVFVTSWSLLHMRYLEILAIKPKFLVVDEAHYAKAGEDTLRGQALSIIARRAPHMIMLTGTPIVNRPAELETIKGLFNQDTDVPMIRRLFEDVLPEVPPKTRSTLPVSLRPKDETEYRKAEKDFADWLEMELQRRMAQGEALAAAERALAAEALVKTGYLRRLLGLAKVPAAVDWIGRAVRIGEPVVVFCEHQEVVTRLQTLLTKQRIRHVTVDGSTARAQRQVAIDGFQAGLVPVFIGTKAAKEGITLTRGRNLMFVERYFTSAEEEQAEDRIRRFGQKYPTTIWFLHAADTIDDRLAEIIDTKRKVVDETIGSTSIEESDEATVVELIAAWHENAARPHQPTAESTDLGLGKPLPPMPSPNECYQLTFKTTRWTKASAKAWAAMHGFRPTAVHLVDDTVRVSVLPLDRFVPGKFHKVAVSADISATLGVRRPTPGMKAAKKKPVGSGRTLKRSTRPARPRSPMLGRR
jgi:SNF2 family DNA or RNA helicase